MDPAGKTPKTKGRRRQVKGVHKVLQDWEEVVKGDVTSTPCSQTPWQRGRFRRGLTTRGLTSRENHRWSLEGPEPREIPMWPERGKSRRAPVRARALRSGRKPENTCSNRRARRGVVDSAQATEKRECAPEGAEHHRCQVPNALQEQRNRWAIREGGT